MVDIIFLIYFLFLTWCGYTYINWDSFNYLVLCKVLILVLLFLSQFWLIKINNKNYLEKENYVYRFSLVVVTTLFNAILFILFLFSNSIEAKNLLTSMFFALFIYIIICFNIISASIKRNGNLIDDQIKGESFLKHKIK